MLKIDRAHKNYLTPEIWEETHLRETFYGTLIFQQSSMICICRQVGGHTLALQHGGQNYFLLISCWTFDSYSQISCKRYHINFSTFSLTFKCKICVQKEVIHIFKNHILVEWPATNWLNLRKWCGFEKPDHYYYIILFKMWPTNRFSKAKSTFIFIKTLSHDLLVQMAYLWTTNKGFAPCKGIQEDPGFWIPYGGFLIPGTGFQSLSVKLGFWIPRLALKWEYRFLELYSGFHKLFFPDSEFHRPKFSGFQNPVALTKRLLSISLRECSTIVFIFDVYSAQRG